MFQMRAPMMARPAGGSPPAPTAIQFVTSTGQAISATGSRQYVAPSGQAVSEAQ